MPPTVDWFDRQYCCNFTTTLSHILKVICDLVGRVFYSRATSQTVGWKYNIDIMNTKLGFRKLKEQQARKKIDHPLAKYNNLQQLSCALCNLPLKNELLWPSHLQSRKHKEAVAALKVKVPESSNASKSFTSSTSIETDRYSPPAKKKYIENVTSNTKQASTIKEHATSHHHSITKEDTTKDALPSDFFDSKVSANKIKNLEESSSIPLLEQRESKSVTERSKPANVSDQLPEGFFDDAKLDAKARKVEYVDKKEEEWEEFQKMIAVESKVSENLQAEEEEDFRVEKDLSEYTALKQYVSRVAALKDKRKNMEKVQNTKKDLDREMNIDEESDSDENLDDILNWRTKKA